jgi:hypothetical protein
LNTLDFTIKQLELLKEKLHESVYRKHSCLKMYFIVPIERYIDECVRACKLIEINAFYTIYQRPFAISTKCAMRDFVVVLERLANRKFPLHKIEPASLGEILDEADLVANFLDPRINWIFFATEPITGIRNLNPLPPHVVAEHILLPQKPLFNTLFDIYVELFTLVNSSPLSREVFGWFDPMFLKNTSGPNGFIRLYSEMKQSYLNCVETSCIFYRTREAINADSINQFKRSITNGESSARVRLTNPPIHEAASLASNVLRRASEYVFW